MQFEIDWTNTVHKKENNPVSQQVLDDNKEHFSKQAQLVYELLGKGIKLTAREAMIQHGIGHLARRIADLREAGINIESEAVLVGGKRSRFVKYYLK
jgi:hypothetical protein